MLVALLAAAPSAHAGDATGRLLVLLDEQRSTKAHAAAATAVVSGAGARRAGRSVPQIGLVTVRPRAGETLSELAARLRADPAARDARTAPRPDSTAGGLAVAARLKRAQCRRSSWPGECHVAVSSRSIRRLYRGMRRSADHRRKAAVLLGVGARLRMSRLEVVNAIRAELDVQLTRAVAARTLPARGRDLALRCYDEPRACGPV